MFYNNYKQLNYLTLGNVVKKFYIQDTPLKVDLRRPRRFVHYNRLSILAEMLPYK